MCVCIDLPLVARKQFACFVACDCSYLIDIPYKEMSTGDIIELEKRNRLIVFLDSRV